jgi:hypothetical protein
MKPPPQLETTDLRLRLHQVAGAGLAIKGHCRLFTYTYPQLALEPAGIAPPKAGWATGTLPVVCSSLLWLACRNVGIQLDSNNAITVASDFEINDVQLGAQANAATLDGLYLNTARERQGVAKWLQGYVHDQAVAQEPGIIDFLGFLI